MHATAQPAASPGLSEAQKAALLSLLGDEDPAVFQAVRHRILECGPSALDWLEPHALSDQPLVRRRVRFLRRHFRRQTADARFLAFCLGHDSMLDLEEGVWRFCQTRDPDLSEPGYRALLDLFAAELRQRIGTEPRETAILGVINEYLFDELGFRSPSDDVPQIAHSYLNRVIDSRTGGALALGLLYWLIAHRLGLPVVGVAMPDHFLCRYQTATGTCFIDPGHRGRLLSRGECIRHLQQSGHGFHEEHLGPASPRRALLRLSGELHQFHARQGPTEAAERIQRYLTALARRAA